MALDKIQIRHAALSQRIVLARFGKDPTVALERRDAMNEFLQAIVSYAFDAKLPQPGQWAEVAFGSGDEQFVMRVERKKEPA